MSNKAVTRPILEKKRSPLALWRRRGIAIVRVLFGCIWAFNAWFAWQFSFASKVTGYLTHTANNQVPMIAEWMHMATLHPHLFAYLVALGETLIALCLTLGLLNNLTCGIGMILSLLLWSTAAGPGGPYGLVSTDVGVMITSVLLFMGLLLSGAGQTFGMDRYLVRRLGRWSFLASGGVKQRLRTQYAFERSVYVTK